MNSSGLKIYAFLSRLALPKSYLGKLMLIALLGIHVPLIALALYFVFISTTEWSSALPVLAILLVATLLGTATTLYVLRALLSPLSLSSRALRNYLDRRQIPSLPTNFTDQAGVMMADVQYIVEHLDEVIASLEEHATRDYLTGVYNRRGGEERLATDLSRVNRGEGNLTLALIDLDRFKAINDQFGHQAGDISLKHVANACVRNIREGDWLARWGGDEFMLVTWDANGNRTASSVLNRIAADLDENPPQLQQGNRICLTLSAGVARYIGSRDSNQSIDEVLAVADRALYQAKKEQHKSTFVYADQ